MKPGDLIAGRFELVRFVARGGMGEVFRARDRVTGEDVAIKLVNLPQPQLGERLAQEARALLELDHPGIVRYVAHESDAQRGLFLAMEWLEGETLAERLRTRPLSVDESLALAARVAEGLGAAHARGMIHRDIKPLNLLLVGGRVEQAKLLDFGIVRLSEYQQITATGVGLGTPEYMAPEQARGEREIGPAADVFALGCVLYKCLTGQAAFRGRRIEAVLAKIAMVDQVPRVSELRADVPAPLDDLVATMMAYAPGDRPADGRAAARHIRAVREALAIGIEPTAQVRPRRALSRHELQPVSVIFADLAIGEADTVPSEVIDVESIVEHGGGSPTVESSFERLQVLRGSSDAARALPAIRRALEPYGAWVELLLNGSVVAMLTGGSAATDLAIRSARCALAIRAILPDAAVGVATGKSLAGDRGELGPIIEEAAGMVRAGSRQIRIDGGTRDLLPARFEVLGDGVDEPGFELYRELVTRRAPAELPRQLLGRETPCIGRNRLLRQLRAVFDGCVDERAAEAVVVVGGAGVGKSRLRAELVSRLGDAHPSMAVVAAWGDPVRSRAPYALLAHALRDRFAIPDGDLSVQRNQLRDELRLRVAPGEVERVVEFVGELIGVRFPAETSPRLRAARTDPELMHAQIRRAFEDWLLAELDAAPVLFLIEDLQWADEPSIELVTTALRRAIDRPLMLFALGRPELQERFPSLGEDWNRQEIVLDTLRAADCEQLIDAALGDQVDETTRARMIAHSAGNPFYLEELIRAAAAGQRDRLPDSIIASVQLRMGRFPDEARQVLRAASIYGRRFSAAGIAALLDDAAEADITGWLDTLAREELVEKRGPDYAFRHDLTREAAYGALTDDDRQTGHRLAGHFLQQAGETDPVVLAEHFAGGGAFDQAVDYFERAAEQALAADDDDDAASALATAAGYFARAGQAAARSYANHAAIGFFERAIAITSSLDPTEAARARLILADVRERVGQRPRALDELAESLAAVPETHLEMRIELILKRAQLEVRSDEAGSLERSRSAARQARDLAQQEGRQDLEAEALAQLAAIIVMEDSEESSRKAVQYAERALMLRGQRGSNARDLWRLGNVFLMRNDLERSFRLYTDALESAETLGDDLLQAHIQANLGMVAFRRWHIDEAIRRSGLALAIYRRIGHTTRVAEQMLNMGTFYHLGGHPEQARPLAAEALHQTSGDWVIASLCRETLADIERHEGNEAAAQAHLSEAIAVCHRVGASEKEAFYLGLLAESLWTTGSFARATEVLERSIDIAGATLSYALLLVRMGQTETARDLLGRFQEEEPDPDRRLLALIALARIALGRGPPDEARSRCAAALELVPAEIERFAVPVLVVAACAENDLEGAMVGLETAARSCGRHAYAELVVDVGELIERTAEVRQ
ncbi:MAG TPA: protein kinase, partial [Kofleriaceae bacterium]|nr:protein kinase [Kofleriaceae bacterium]